MTTKELRQKIREEWLKYDEQPYMYETAFEDGFKKGYELAQKEKQNFHPRDY